MKDNKSKRTSSQPEENQKTFPLVGIAASAGGLEAFTQLLQHLPTDTGMAFVLIQHLDPNNKSTLSEILGKTTQMPVREVQSGMSVEPNCVYVIPPNTKMTLAGGVLQLTAREKIQGKYMPADAFFASLAAERGSQALGVVLSGTDGDGAQGVEAIKQAGGITFAQCEVTAKFDGMPSTAVATGQVDFILPPQRIASELAKISTHPYITRPAQTTTEQQSDFSDALPAIFAMLRSATKVDFTYYKRSTVDRRIARRMLLYKLELEEYARYLQAHPAEIKALYQELLISVTNFFRDREAFAALKQQVFPIIAAGKSGESPIRIWVAGCATGEEVYSIAICLQEFLEGTTQRSPFQIFATDISESAIDTARAGIYKQSQMADVSPEQLRSFFVKVEGGYQIAKVIRERCVFARQNLIGDPAFSNLDLISCRNVMIYLGPSLQQQVFQVFHYSLKPTSFLLLGSSESVGDSNLFALVDKKSKLYARKQAPNRPSFNFVINNALETNVNDAQTQAANASDLEPEKEADRIVLNQHAPAGVITNDEMEILQFRGDTSPYLRPAPGKASLNLIKMARASLLPELRTAMHQAKRQDSAVRKSGLRMEENAPPREVSIEVIPFKASPAQSRYFLVIFKDTPPALVAAPPQASKTKLVNKKQTDSELEIVRLQQELAATQEYLQVTIQEQEATNQELRVANEEILSSNEELQSTNEELETAKEEIQATNEELNTTNDELRSRIQESNQVNSDLRNLLSSVKIPIIMLGNDLSIRRFTPMAEKSFNLLPTDIGRPINHIKHNLNVANLEQLIYEVMDTLVIKEQEVQDTKGHWYDLRIRPYKTTENQIDGTVVVLVDIDALKRSTEQLKEARDYAEAIVETIRQPLIVLNADLKVSRANRSFYEMFQVSPTQTEHCSIFELGNGQWNIPQLRSLLEEVLPENNEVYNFEVEHVFEQIGRKTMLVNACRIMRAGNDNTVLLAIEDITNRKLFEAQRNQLLTHEQSARYAAEAANRAKDRFLSIVSHELRNPLNSMLGWTQLLRNRSFDAAQTAHALSMVERSAKAQAKLIEDLLDVSSIAAGKLQLNVRQIALLPVIEAAINVVRPSAEAKNIQLQAVLEPETITVSGDPERLQQVLWNLLSNAIKFTPAGGRVIVKLERTGTYAQITLSDTGQGINADFLPYVFDQFRQADSSSTRSQGGLGLGLSIVRQLVELHGGTVRAESPGEGQGTTMSVRLPLQLPIDSSLESDLEQVSTVEPLEPLDSVPTLSGLRVLIVDDEAGMLELLKTIVEQYGAQVSAVASAQEAISVLTAHPGQYDVLLSDIGMPDEDGCALIRQVRALSAQMGGQIPAAALTAYVSLSEQTQALAAGFQRHIAKPVEPAQLASIIAQLAARRRT